MTPDVRNEALDVPVDFRSSSDPRGEGTRVQELGQESPEAQQSTTATQGSDDEHEIVTYRLPASAWCFGN